MLIHYIFIQGFHTVLTHLFVVYRYGSIYSLPFYSLKDDLGIIISKDSIDGTDSQKLFYKLVLLDAMHGKVGQDTLNEAASDLGISEYWLGIYTKP